jgi:hypothetical protein
MNLTAGARKKLGTLENLAENTVAEAVRLRGGTQSQVHQIRTDYQHLLLGDIANRAAQQGDADAETAIKIVKQAAKKAQRYGSKR